MADLGWRRRWGSSPAARRGARQRAGLTPACASNTLPCQCETLRSKLLWSIKNPIDSDHGIYRDSRESLKVSGADVVRITEGDMDGRVSASGRPARRGVFGSSGQVHRHIKKLRLLFRYPRSEPYFMTWLVPHQIKLTSGRHSKQLHQYPAFGGWGSGGRDHSFTRLFKPVHCSVPIAWIRQDRLGPGDWGI